MMMTKTFGTVRASSWWLFLDDDGLFLKNNNHNMGPHVGRKAILRHHSYGGQKGTQTQFLLGTKHLKYIENKIIKNRVFERNGRHHELSREKLRLLAW